MFGLFYYICSIFRLIATACPFSLVCLFIIILLCFHLFYVWSFLLYLLYLPSHRYCLSLFPCVFVYNYFTVFSFILCLIVFIIFALSSVPSLLLVHFPLCVGFTYPSVLHCLLDKDPLEEKRKKVRVTSALFSCFRPSATYNKPIWPI